MVDVGCGTGLAGPQLRAVGFKSIHGFDLSHEMTAQAERTGAYDAGCLWGGIDLNQPFELGGDLYNGGIATGVFTSGHVKPDSLGNIIPHMTKGAVFVFTAREAYAKDHNLDAYLAGLESQGRVRTLAIERSLPYLDITKAHYYCVQVLE